GAGPGDGIAAAGVALARALVEFFRAKGHVRERLVVARLGLELAARVDDVRTRAVLLTELGSVHFHRHRLGEAGEHLRQALPLWRRLGDRLGEARVLNVLGVLAGEAGEHEEALRFMTGSLRLRPREDVIGRAATLGNIGRLHTLVGEHDRAVRRLRSAIALARRCGDLDIEANALINLGDTYAALGHHDTALRHLHRSLDIAPTIADRIKASTLKSLAEVYERSGRHDLAVRHARLAVETYRTAEFPRGEALALADLGRLLRTTDPAASRRILTRARDLLAALDDPDTPTLDALVRGS
ncbi:MAG TPA: tetratricopeptide repeat protein, partial [Pseudonocardiaceae bacterium]